MDHIDLSGYFAEEKGCKTGRPRCDAEKLLKPYASDMECFVPLMEKYMKFTMFDKETKDSKYHNKINRQTRAA